MVVNALRIRLGPQDDKLPRWAFLATSGAWTTYGLPWGSAPAFPRSGTLLYLPNVCAGRLPGHSKGISQPCNGRAMIKIY